MFGRFSFAGRTVFNLATVMGAVFAIVPFTALLAEIASVHKTRDAV